MDTLAGSAPSYPADLTSRRRATLAGDLGALLTGLRSMMTPDGWDNVSSAMSLLTGQSLERRLLTVCSAVTALPASDLGVLLELFHDVTGDLLDGAPHRRLDEAEAVALEHLRDVLATV